jgi:hypothetical protein
LEKQGNGLQTYTLGKNESTTNTLAKSRDAPHFFVLSNCSFYFALAPLLLENFAKENKLQRCKLGKHGIMSVHAHQSRHIRRRKSKNAVCDGMTTTAVENLPMMRKFQSSFSCEDHHPLYQQLMFFVCVRVFLMT